MRIIIQFSSVEENLIPISYFNNKFMIQGFFYNCFLKSEKLKEWHEKRGFKFFCFSDVFEKNEIYTLLFSSPIKGVVKEVRDILKKLRFFYLGFKLFKIEKIKSLQLKVGKKIVWETGSPIVIYFKNKPFSFYKDKEYAKFFERIKENAVKKYSIFSGKTIVLRDSIFDQAVFRKSVAIPLKGKGKEFIIFGSCWKKLTKDYIEKDERKFYEFLLDCGLGEKNSLGFGFLNPIKKFA